MEMGSIDPVLRFQDYHQHRLPGAEADRADYCPPDRRQHSCCDGAKAAQHAALLVGLPETFAVNDTKPG